MADIADLQQKKNEAWQEARNRREKWEEKDEDQRESWRQFRSSSGYDDLMDDVADLKQRIDDKRREREIEREQEERRLNGEGDDPEPGNPGNPRGGRPGAGEEEEAESRDLPPLFRDREQRNLSRRERRLQMAYRDYGRNFPDLLESRNGERPDLSGYREAFQHFISRDMTQKGLEGLEPEEKRDLLAGSDPEGGYTVPPNFAANLLQKLDDEVVIRQFADVVPVNTGDSLGVPTLEKDPSDPVWTQEVNTGDEDSQMEFGDRELHPHPLAKRAKVSRKLIRSAAIGVESVVRERLGYKFRVAEEKAFMTGSGSQEPLGLFTADSNGISTSRDVTEDANTTSTTFDHLKSVKWALKAAYQENARWIMHRDIGKQIDKIKDGEGQYIWQMSTQADEPDRLLGAPVSFSEFAPSTTTSGDYIALYGDLSFYRIADALDLTMQRLAELYAEENKIGFIGRLEADGMPVFEEAFSRAQLA